jgi:shikimate dehydrogenase
MTGAIKLAGVIGWPVAQSLSPRLHSYWLREHKIDGAYLPLPVRREDFARVALALRRAGFRGLSVTVPHKQAAFSLAHRVDRAAKLAGAVNQLIFHEDGSLEGLNTDAGGLAESLAAIPLEGKAATLLGAGGAARAAVLALDRLGAAEIRILNRHPARAGELACALASAVRARLVVAKAWSDAAGDAALLLNATSAGMSGTPSPDIALALLPGTATVCDIVYNPLQTPLLERARAAGLKTVDGLGMLMHQAAPAFKAFYGVEPKVTPELRRELEMALGHG